MNVEQLHRKHRRPHPVIGGDTIALLVISDGRDDYLAESIASARQMLPPVFDQIVHIDDRAHELGYGGAIRAAWEKVDADWVFHLEGDFTFNAAVDVIGMIDVLRARPDLAQIVLKRQPWNPQEVAAGGIIEQHPGDYSEVVDGPYVWTTHRRFFSTNPCVYARHIVERGWPTGTESEGRFGLDLVADGYHFAFWGGKGDPPAVHHIGVQRAGGGY